jgi:hypothetical protein
MDPLDTPTSDTHEWLSFDHEDETYQFDITFLTSAWSCIFGAGCLGVLTGPAPELVHGCCTYGAHFVDKADRKKVAALAEQLTAEQWQYRKKANKLGGPVHRNEHGEWVTRTVRDACIFLNRVGFAAGPGCALHQVAVESGERPMDWKPTVCWQLPLRLEERVDDVDHRTWILREWKRRDWGPGGAEFHWWCTEGPEAFAHHQPVYLTLRDEIVELVGEEPFARLCELLEQRATETLLPHPAVRRRR